MRDIAYKEDIVLLVNEFYSKIQSDSVIGYIFMDVAKLNWDLHLPKMCSFWGLSYSEQLIIRVIQW